MEQNPNEKIFKEIQEIVDKRTDTYIYDYEAGIKSAKEKANLTIWIIGLSISLEVFLLSNWKRINFDSYISLILFIVISGIFLYNGAYALLLRIKQTRLIQHYLETQTCYNYQKTNILLKKNAKSHLAQVLINDHSNDNLSKNLINLEYVDKSTKETMNHNDKINEDGRKFMQNSDNIASKLFSAQVVLTLLLLLSIYFHK